VRITRGLATAAVVVSAALGLAAPVQAQGDVKAPGTPEGVYTVDIAGQGTTTWEIYPICVPTVGDLREPLLLPVACRLKVTPAGRGGSEANQTGGRWTFMTNALEAIRKCPDGTEAKQDEIYSFDGVTLVGSLKVIHGAVCGEQPGMVEVPLTLTFKEPLPIPVTDYPLICEPGGLRRCF
jgi:hypothetical protein